MNIKVIPALEDPVTDLAEQIDIQMLPLNVLIQGVFFNWSYPKNHKYGKKLKYQNWSSPKNHKYQNWSPP